VVIGTGNRTLHGDKRAAHGTLALTRDGFNSAKAGLTYTTATAEPL
jgi:hypothetical protein